ncbi:hypothetical protein Pint_32885 [Pistacia integerrima]|uniref:Uncharacterized protein n=1 Tax=Pistacia integerrima TaxID=434235 RepID=A0ACC0X4C8_9ROSI|nr:hypothetical protein Pint_32885 [Pistacia integerrima]
MQTLISNYEVHKDIYKSNIWKLKNSPCQLSFHPKITNQTRN